jgi:hypothetical protein
MWQGDQLVNTLNRSSHKRGIFQLLLNRFPLCSVFTAKWHHRGLFLFSLSHNRIFRKILYRGLRVKNNAIRPC